MTGPTAPLSPFAVPNAPEAPRLAPAIPANKSIPQGSAPHGTAPLQEGLECGLMIMQKCSRVLNSACLGLASLAHRRLSCWRLLHAAIRTLPVMTRELIPVTSMRSGGEQRFMRRTAPPVMAQNLRGNPTGGCGSRTDGYPLHHTTTPGILGIIRIMFCSGLPRAGSCRLTLQRII